jgi:hypothetical protein
MTYDFVSVRQNSHWIRQEVSMTYDFVSVHQNSQWIRQVVTLTYMILLCVWHSPTEDTHSCYLVTALLSN